MSKRLQCPVCLEHFTPQGYRNHTVLGHGEYHPPVGSEPADQLEDDDQAEPVAQHRPEVELAAEPAPLRDPDHVVGGSTTSSDTKAGDELDQPAGWGTLL